MSKSKVQQPPVPKKAGRTPAHVAAMKRYYRQVHINVDAIFANVEGAHESAFAFVRAYESQFGKFPFPYARANTEFGVVFGRNVSAEDAGWGEFRPGDDPPTAREIEKQVDMFQKLMDRDDAEKEKENMKSSNKKQEARTKRLMAAWQEAGCQDTFMFEGKKENFLPGLFSGLVAEKVKNPPAAPQILTEPKYAAANIPLAEGMKREYFPPLEQAALKLWDNDKTTAAELGRALFKVKMALAHGQFSPWWEAHGLTQTRVSYCMGKALEAEGITRKKQSNPANTWARDTYNSELPKADLRATKFKNRLEALVSEKSLTFNRSKMSPEYRSELIAALHTTAAKLRECATQLATEPPALLPDKPAKTAAAVAGA